jgi:hypothetical protein
MLQLTTRVLGALLFIQAGTPPAKQTWIADLKAKRAVLGTAEVRVLGDVVDIRSTSPTAKFGFYRLIDASDPTGLLVRTNKLPKDGGSFHLRARVAAQQPPDGTLLLDELERSQTEKRSVLALVLGVISVLAMIVLAVLLGRAAVEERRYRVAPPLWLLPEAGPYGKALTVPGGPTPPLKYSPELEEQDRRQHVLLRARKRRLFHLTIGSLAATAACGGWLLLSRPASAQVPAFIFIEANDIPIPAAVSPGPGTAGDTTLAQLMLPPRQDSLLALQVPVGVAGGTRRRDSARAARASNPPVLHNVPDSAASPAAIPAPAPSPAPPPAPAPPVPPPAPPEANPPPRNPEVERSRAAGVLAEGVGSLVQAINARRMSEFSTLLPEALAEDTGQRERFLKLINDFSPRATMRSIEEVALSEDRGEAKFTISLTWRGDFGVGHRKAGRFLGVVRRQGNEWQFDGARLLNTIP